MIELSMWTLSAPLFFWIVSNLIGYYFGRETGRLEGTNDTVQWMIDKGVIKVDEENNNFRGK